MPPQGSVPTPVVAQLKTMVLSCDPIGFGTDPCCSIKMWSHGGRYRPLGIHWITDPFGLVSPGSWILDSGLWHLDSGLWFLDSGSWILDPGFWILDSGFYILDSGFWTLDSGFWILDSGF